MKHPVIAIGLDSADPVLLENWMAQGYLKNLSKLREKGAYGRLASMEYYKGESAWTNFTTACLPHKTGYWCEFRFNPEAYDIKRLRGHGGYDYSEFSPFYALGDDYKVAMFDLPQTVISDQVNGIQVIGWGAHSPMADQQSEPKELIGEILEKYGDHPADVLHHQDRSDWYNPASIEKLRQELTTGLKRRTAITKDLLKREPWDLFLTVMGEPHTALHYFWHLSESQKDHPLYDAEAAAKGDMMLEFMEGVDQSLGEILAEAPEDAYVLVFAAHGMGHNSTDVLSMPILSEFLYRFSFPGKSILVSEEMGTTPSGLLTPENIEESWYRVIQKFRNEPKWIKFRKDLLKPLKPLLPSRLHYYLTKLMGVPSHKFGLHPTMWYHPFWSDMKAFALPTFSEGYIRINLKGRESKGIVDPADYHALCDELTEQLYQLTDARNGKPIVKKIVRTRKDPLDSNPKLPDADLAVIWEDWAVDVVDSPKYGRMGPVFFNRGSSHRARGFLAATGPGIEPGSKLPEGHAVDLAPTILELMGAPIPEGRDGKPLMNAKVLV